MATEEYEEDNNDDFEGNPESLRDNDEIDDAEEAFMEGYEEDLEEEEEKELEEEPQ